MRVTVVVGALLALAAAALLLYSRGPSGIPMPCLLHEFTGMHCAGCGMTRATHAALEGRVLEAFRFNPLGVILLPVAFLALIPEVLGWIRDRPPKWRLAIGWRGSVALVALVIGYTVLRNLPWMPFTLLAPP